MATDVIDIQFHLSAFPSNYVGKGTLVGNPYYASDTDICNGYFTSGGNAVSIPLGFVAQEVDIFVVDDVVEYIWRRGLAATKTIKVVTAGAVTIDTTSAITVTVDKANGTSTILLSSAIVGTGKTVLYNVKG